MEGVVGGADYVAELERLNAEQSEMLRIAEGETLWRDAAKAQSEQDRERIANQAEQVSILIARNGELEADIARLKLMLHDRDVALLMRRQTLAATTEAALVERSFPENALKHSR